MMNPYKILIVDQSVHVRKKLSTEFTIVGFDRIYEAENGVNAILLIRREQPDFIILENILPDMLGTEILRKVRKYCQQTAVIILSNFAHKRVMERAKRYGAAGLVVKPFASSEIIRIVMNHIPDTVFDIATA